MHVLAQRTGLLEAIDRRLHLSKGHLPYHESNQVLNIACNLVAGGRCLDPGVERLLCTLRPHASRGYCQVAEFVSRDVSRQPSGKSFAVTARPA